MPRPDPTEYAPDHGKNVVLVPEVDILTALEQELSATLALMRSVPEEAENMVVIEDRELADRYCTYIDGLTKRYASRG